jgi:hypothetical protein
MDRRTPGQQHWAKLLSVSFDAGTPAAGATVDGEPVDPSIAIDDLVAKATVEVERHAASALSTRNRLQALHGKADATLRAAAREAEPGRPGASPGLGGRGQVLDVRR